MGWFSKLTIFFAMLSLYASFVHRPIPADVPDKAYFQFIVDYLSAVEIAVSMITCMPSYCLMVYLVCYG